MIAFEKETGNHENDAYGDPGVRHIEDGPGVERGKPKIYHDEVHDSPAGVQHPIRQVAERAGKNECKRPVQEKVGPLQKPVVNDEDRCGDEVEEWEDSPHRKAVYDSRRIYPEDRHFIEDQHQLHDTAQAMHDATVRKRPGGDMLCPQIREQPDRRHDGKKAPGMLDLFRQCIFLSLDDRLKIQYSGIPALPPFIPYLKIARMKNAGMAAAAVCLGFWIGRSILPLRSLLFLCIAAATATAFGNVVNDRRDVATDRISHPDRPLASGELTLAAAGWYAVVLALLSLGFAALASPAHLFATLIPLALLILYTRFLKATPLAGNIVVSLLVAYPLVYGGLLGSAFYRLLVPAGAAFLASLLREIVKDLQDEPGDKAAGIVTTAAVSSKAIDSIIIVVSVLFLVILPVPYLLHRFGRIYVLVCLLGIVPLHLYWLSEWFERKQSENLPLLSAILKVELVLGLVAMAADQLIKR